MSAPGWTQVKGGTHFCGLCHGFVQATSTTPVWLYYASSTTSTSCACAACAVKL